MELEIGYQTEQTYSVKIEDAKRFFDNIGREMKQGDRIQVPGIFVSHFICQMLSESLTYAKRLCLSQSIKFPRTVFVGDDITVTIIVSYYRDGDTLIQIRCTNQDQKLVAEGESQLFIDDSNI